MDTKKKIVISTGAGMSAESGMATYRDAGGLWDNYPVMQVASADASAAILPSFTVFTAIFAASWWVFSLMPPIMG